MKLEVKNLINQAEGEVETHPFDLENIVIDVETKAKATGQVILTNLGDFILAQITGSAELIQPCSRCLKDANLNVALDFSREFRMEIPDRTRNENPSAPPLGKGRLGGISQDDGDVMESDEEVYLIVDGQIDLLPPMTEEIIANIPFKILCNENCQGLCPKCGANLNDNPCKCDKVEFEISNKINL